MGKAFADTTVAVVIPVYGREDAFVTVGLLRKWPSACRLRILIVDNGNGPELSARLGTLAGDDCEVIRLETNQGGAGAYRAGMLAALKTDAEYLWLLDDDALPNERTLPGLLSVFAEESARGGAPVGVVGSAMLGRVHPKLVTEVGCHVSRLTGLRRRYLEGADIESLGERTFPVDYCAAASFLVRREAVEKVGVFEDIFIHQDDVDFCFRVREGGFRVLATTRSTVNHPEETEKFALWLLYFDRRNKIWMIDRHLPWCVRIGFRILQNAYWLMFRYHGFRSAADLIRLGIRHAKTGERLMRTDLRLPSGGKTVRELVADADFVGVLARPEEIAAAMRTELSAAGVSDPQVIVCWPHGVKSFSTACRAFFAQLRMQIRIWRAHAPVVFQDCFCVRDYPLRLFCRRKVFFTASNGKVEIIPS